MWNIYNRRERQRAIVKRNLHAVKHNICATHVLDSDERWHGSHSTGAGHRSRAFQFTPTLALSFIHSKLVLVPGSAPTLRSFNANQHSWEGVIRPALANESDMSNVNKQPLYAVKRH